MRMKKLLIIAAAALLAAACAKTYEVKETTTPAIGFGTWTETLTKAHDPSGNEFGTGDTFNVYGFKTISSTSTAIFDGTVVTKETSAWTYAPKRFWDPSASSYTFFAVAPAGLGVTATQTSGAYTGALTSGDVEFLGGDTDKGNIKDVLVAAKKEVANADFGNTVNLDFYHVAALLDLKIQKHNDLELPTGEDASNYIKVEVTSVSLTNIDGTGTFSISEYGASDPYAPVLGASTWTPNTSAAKKTYNHTSGYETVTLPTDVNAVSANSPDALISKLVVMPQTFRAEETDHSTDQTVNIAYTITTCESGNSSSTDYTASFDLKEFDTAQDYNNTSATYIAGWAPGTHYTYIITIGANAITFAATIANWTAATDNGYHYLTN